MAATGPKPPAGPLTPKPPAGPKHNALDTSPFDAIKRTDETGAEFWSARDLMPVSGYDRWQKFEDAIGRAMLAARNTGSDVVAEFSQVTQLTGAGNLGDQARKDYRLSRYAAYLTAMNGDPRKPEIAAAQMYFAIRTREAETAPALDPTSLDRRALALMVIEAEDAIAAEKLRSRELEKELEAVAPMVDGYQQLMASNGGRLIREVAKTLGWQEKALRSFLLEEHLIFVRQAVCGQNQYDVYAAYSPHFKPVEKVVTHTWGDCAHYTLTVLPRGIDLIRKRIADRQAALHRELAAS